MKKKPTPAPRRAGNTKRNRDRALDVIAVLIKHPDKLEAWLRAGERRCRKKRIV